MEKIEVGTKENRHDVIIASLPIFFYVKSAIESTDSMALNIKIDSCLVLKKHLRPLGKTVLIYLI